MRVHCEKCHMMYDDEFCFYQCPHNPLTTGPRLQDYCKKHDLIGPCPLCANVPPEQRDPQTRAVVRDDYTPVTSRDNDHTQDELADGPPRRPGVPESIIIDDPIGPSDMTPETLAQIMQWFKASQGDRQAANVGVPTPGQPPLPGTRPLLLEHRNEWDNTDDTVYLLADFPTAAGPRPTVWCNLCKAVMLTAEDWKAHDCRPETRGDPAAAAKADLAWHEADLAWHEATRGGKGFTNVWGDDAGMTQQCCDCGGLVHGLEELRTHRCPEPRNSTEPPSSDSSSPPSSPESSSPAPPAGSDSPR